jgi:hypothetical protein
MEEQASKHLSYRSPIHLFIGQWGQEKLASRRRQKYTRLRAAVRYQMFRRLDSRPARGELA